MTDLLEELFSCDLSIAMLHDVVSEAIEEFDKQYTEEQLRTIFIALPRSLQLDAFQWGFDTVVRDAIFVHIKKHGLNND